MGRSKDFSPFDIEMMKDDAEMMVDVQRRFRFCCRISMPLLEMAM
jgi:hypothetical protein